MLQDRFVGFPFPCGIIRARRSSCAAIVALYLWRTTQPLQNTSNFLNSHSGSAVTSSTPPPGRDGHFHFDLVIWIVASSRGTLTILSALSMPAMTFPNTV